MNKNKIKAILEKNNYWISCGGDDIEFGKHTPLGEDWFECLSWKSADEFMYDFERRVNGFDVDDEAEPFIEIRGTRGVPERITDLIHDAEWKQEQLEQLLKELKGV